MRLGVCTGNRAPRMYPSGLEFLTGFLGCLYAGAVAVPTQVPRPNRPSARLRSILADAQPKWVLTTSAVLADRYRYIESMPELAGPNWIATDTIAPALADRCGPPDTDAEAIAFLQYTSGSTADPKGVMVTHGNLLHNSALIRSAFASSPEDRGVFWLPLHHDMGLIGGVLQTVYCGCSSVLMPPVVFLQRPILWLRAISEFGATISGGPDFAYAHCTRRVTEQEKLGLDLSRWSIAFIGAEQSATAQQ